MTIREIDQLIEEVNSLKVLTQAFGEIASIKLTRIRSQVERNRLFFAEIAQIFKIVKNYGAKKGFTLNKPKQTVSLLLTSNERFYGGIDAEVIRYFIEVTAKYPTDRVVLGITGKEYLNTMNYFHQFQNLTFKADLPNDLEFNQVGQIIKDYKQVIVFYPQITTILIQKPRAYDITQSSFGELTPNSQLSLDYVIFEPELEKIIEFFDTQIMILILQQVFFESELARTASRLMSMDQAQIAANKFIDTQLKLRIRIKRDQTNKQILQNFSSMAALKQEEVGL
ncbi:hypothetical protein A3D79_00080 [Candidatus Daviesbacteria bacterium RIFCSPHIGHO2_02_FULL_39_8]|nr:MAG: hypothetical protein A3D79_00080 [Candidatus Daviesbacteria bacterium RIFCSPHIGHO2_02_FULL_39_8]